MTATWAAAGRHRLSSATKVEARTTSSVVTPKMRFWSYTPCFLKTSATIGTMELTGFEMTAIRARGQCSAQAVASECTMPALMPKRSSRDIPGYNKSLRTFRGTPAGMTTTAAPISAFLSCSGPMCAVTRAGVLTWERSAATPGVPTISYKASSLTRSLVFSSRERGAPMPPAAPQTATLTIRRKGWPGWGRV